MFAFRTGAGAQAWTVVRRGRDGKVAPLFSKPSMYYSPRYSPDGRRLAVAIDRGKGMDIVVHDIERDTTSPVTFSAATNADPVWTPDGAHFVFKSLAAKTWHLLVDSRRRCRRSTVAPRNAGAVGDLSASAISPVHSPFDLLALGSGERCGPVGSPVGCERSGSSQGRTARAVPSDTVERDAPGIFSRWTMGCVHLERDRRQRGLRSGGREFAGCGWEVASLERGRRHPHLVAKRA